MDDHLTNNCTNHNKQGIIEEKCQTTNNRGEPLDYRFPGYNWDSSNDSNDEEICVNVPDYTDHNLFGKTRYRSLHSNNAKKCSRTIMPTIPYNMWNPMVNWIKGTRWSDKSPDHNKRSDNTQSTWIEMTLAFQLQTGYNILGEDADLKEQSECFRAAFVKVMQKSSIHIDGNKMPYRKTFAPSDRIGSVRQPCSSAFPLLFLSPALSPCCLSFSVSV